MADNTNITPGTGEIISTDDLGGGIKVQRVKAQFGVDGSATDVAAATPFPVDLVKIPASAALSDTTANPTTTMIGAGGMGWNAPSTVWERIRTIGGMSAGVQGAAGILAVMPMVLEPGAGNWMQRNAKGAGDGDAGGGANQSAPQLYNGATYDRQRNNVEGTLLASAARTANAQSANQTNYNARGVMIWLNVSAKAAATTLGLSLVGVSPDAPGNFQEYARITGWAAPINTSAMLIVYPGATTAPDVASAINVASARSLPLPRTWFIYTTHGDASSITYSVGYSLVV